MQPWQHLSGFPLSGQSSLSSVGHVVRQSHLDLSSGQVYLNFLPGFREPAIFLSTFYVHSKGEQQKAFLAF